MKKNYMRPESTVMTIETAPMLDTSNPDVHINNSESVNAANVDSREFDDWDD